MMTHLGTTLKHMYNYEYGLNKHRHMYKIIQVHETLSHIQAHSEHSIPSNRLTLAHTYQLMTFIKRQQ